MCAELVSYNHPKERSTSSDSVAATSSSGISLTVSHPTARRSRPSNLTLVYRKVEAKVGVECILSEASLSKSTETPYAAVGYQSICKGYNLLQRAITILRQLSSPIAIVKHRISLQLVGGVLSSRCSGRSLFWGWRLFRRRSLLW